jgi:hypothetical protein
LRYDGKYDAPINDAWYVAEDTGGGVTGNFTTGGLVTWDNGAGLTGQGICASFEVVVGGPNYTRLYLVEVEGVLPNDNGVTVYTDVESGNTFTIAGSRRGQPLLEATSELDSTPLADTVTKYLEQLDIIQTSITADAKVPGLGPITGGFQSGDTVYAARDFFSVAFDAGVNEPNLGDEITIGTFSGFVAGIDITASTWADDAAEGYLYLEPKQFGTTQESIYNSQVTAGSTITNTTQTNTLGTVNPYINTDTPATWRRKGLLWKATQANGWEHVDTGWSVPFNAGTNAPGVQTLPLYYTNSTTIAQDTGWLNPDSVNQYNGKAALAPWSNLANATSSNNTYATCSLSGGQDSAMLEASFVDTVDDTVGDVIGMEFRIEARASVINIVTMEKLYLVDQGGGVVESFGFETLDKGSTTAELSSSDAFYTFGGQVDMMGWPEKTIDDFNSGRLRVRAQFRLNGGGSATVSVDTIQIKYHYVPRELKVYFYDTINFIDQTSALLHSFNVLDGSFPNNDATGWFTIHDLADPKFLRAGLEVRTEPAGAGTLIATTSGRPRYNFMPGSYDLELTGSRWQTLEANFYENEDGRAVYGATGASPSFSFDINERFSYTRLPISAGKDKPRHIAFQQNHLLLSVGSFVLVSAPGSPSAFNPIEGGSSWSVKDPVTGLLPTASNATAVLCRESIFALIGTNFDPSTGDAYTQVVEPESGCIEYTAVIASGKPLYVDHHGVSTIETSDKYGDFKTRPYSRAIYQWLKDRVTGNPRKTVDEDRPVQAIPVRNKNQYRVFFGDGYILNMSLPVGQEDFAKPMLMHYDTVNFSGNYVPTWLDSKVLSSGRERVVMGTEDGEVYIVDGVNKMEVDATEVDCYITINPYNGNYPQGSTKFPTVTVAGDFFEAQSLSYTIADSYNAPSGTEFTRTIGKYSNPPTLAEGHGYTDINVDTYTDGFGLKLRTTMDGSQPHTLHTLLLHTRQKGANRNNVQVPRG